MKRMIRNFMAVGLVALAFIGCTVTETSKMVNEQEIYEQGITIDGESFVDGAGRQILLNGVNLVNKNPEEQYIGKEGPETFQNFKKWGFNVIRLGIIWDGLEPEPGIYNEAYLTKIDQQIEWAKAAGLYVFLDMHQDLFSVKYSDGAPEWATLDEGKPHVTGSVWSDAYLISPAVQTAWDNFWANQPVEDGMGVQDHYANAWKHVANRYEGNATVIGYDMMNEPFAGSDAQYFMPVLFTAYAQLVSQETGKPMTAEEVGAMWGDTQSRYEALQAVATKERFSQVMDAVYELNSEFEKGPLQAFYQKVADAIRSVDRDKILFFNHSYFCNSGVSTALRPVQDRNGQADSLVAYAAHGYDLLVDTDQLSNSSDERLELIFERIYRSGQSMNVPVLIGEWGALGGESPGRTALARKNLGLFEKFLFSNTYWAYGLGTENYSYFKNGVVRPYPVKISGHLKAYSYQVETGVFSCKWTESSDVNAPTRIYIPDLNLVSRDQIMVTPESDGYIIEPIEDGTGGYLIIASLGVKQERALRLVIEKEAEEVISLSVNK